MRIHTIKSLEELITDVSVALDQIKLPKINNSVRAIFDECAPKVFIAPDYAGGALKRQRQIVPDLQSMAIACRQAAIEDNSIYTPAQETAIALVKGFFAGSPVLAISRAYTGTFGLIGVGLSIAATAATSFYFRPRQPYSVNRNLYHALDSLRTEIKSHKAFFSKNNCKAIETAIRAKLQQMKKNDIMMPKYEKALVQLKQQRGYSC